MSEKVAEISYQVFQFKDGSYLAGSDQDGIKATTRIIRAIDENKYYITEDGE